MNLIVGDRRPPKEGQSYMGEGSAVRRAAGPVFSLHESIVGCRTAKSDSVSLTLGPNAGEGAAPGHSSLEMVDVRGFQTWACGLIVTAILIEPRNRIGIGPAVRCFWRQFSLLTTALTKRQGRTRPCKGIQEPSSTHRRTGA